MPSSAEPHRAECSQVNTHVKELVTLPTWPRTHFLVNNQRLNSALGIECLAVVSQHPSTLIKGGWSVKKADYTLHGILHGEQSASRGVSVAEPQSRTPHSFAYVTYSEGKTRGRVRYVTFHVDPVWLQQCDLFMNLMTSIPLDV